MKDYEIGPEGQIVMLCQVCGSRCHAEGAKEGLFVDRKATEESGSPVYKRGRCPMCCCHDCVQVSDDPVRAHLKPLVLGQTTDAGVHKLKDEKYSTKFPAPGPLNIADAMKDIQGLLGNSEPQKPQTLPAPLQCRCGEPAVSRCLCCEDPFCARCLELHRSGEKF